MICRYARMYSGLRPPKCNEGSGCYLCNQKRALQEIARIIDLGVLDLKNKSLTDISLLHTRLKTVLAVTTKDGGTNS